MPTPFAVACCAVSNPQRTKQAFRKFFQCKPDLRHCPAVPQKLRSANRASEIKRNDISCRPALSRGWRHPSSAAAIVAPPLCAASAFKCTPGPRAADPCA